jgi:thioredoxin reductase (NADPH)
MMETTPTSVHEPTWDSSANGRLQQMLPSLTAAQIAEIAPLGTERTFTSGTMLWNVGDRNADFDAMLHGTLEVVRRDALGVESVVASHTRGRFSGEASMLSGRGMTLAGRAGNELRVLALPVAGLRELLVTRSRLSAIIMRSFIPASGTHDLRRGKRPDGRGLASLRRHTTAAQVPNPEQPSVPLRRS